MRSRWQHWHGSYLVKLALVAALAALGDYLFWQQGQWGGVQGLFGFGLIGAEARALQGGPAPIA